MIKKLCFIAFAITSQLAVASPWIDTGDTQLKHSLDLLASYGVITHPINQYPLMWQGIATDLVNAPTEQLPENVKFAISHVEHALRLAKQNRHSSIRAYTSSQPSLSQGFSLRDKAKSGIDSSSQLIGERVSAKVAVNFQRDGLDGKKINHEGSHVAVLFDNWSFSLENLSYWWGPANENPQLLSNHAPAMSAVRLTRASSQQGPSFLTFLGPWQLTAIAAKQRPTKSALEKSTLWAVRFAAMPIAGLEVATSTLKSAFVYDFAQSNATPLAEIDSQALQSIDLKYSTRLLDWPVAVYGEWMGHNQSGWLPKSPTATLGVETFSLSEHSRNKYYLEYTDNERGCDAKTWYYDCQADGFKNSTFQVRDVTINNPIVQGKAWVFGVDRFESSGVGYNAKIKHQQLAQGDQDELQIGYQQGLLGGLWRVNASYIKTHFAGIDDKETRFASSWEYRFY